MSGISPQALADLRAREFPITHGHIYLNTATQAPLPSSTCRALERAIAQAQYPGLMLTPPYGERARAGLATLLRVEPTELVFTSSTTHGLNICANGIDWRPGDAVVIPEREFPSLMYTWLRLQERGVEVRVAPWSGAGPSVDAIMAAVDGRTRVVACSAVAWDSGFQIDLAELGRRCAAAGCLLIVDGIQAVGAIDMRPRDLGISALSFHCYKWLLAGFGVGALYVAPEAIDQIRPTFVGEQSVLGDGEPAFPIAWQPGAGRYAVGASNMLGLAALAESLDLIDSIGIAAIEGHQRALTGQLIDGLRAIPALTLVGSAEARHRSAIVVVTTGGRARDEALVEALGGRSIQVALRRRGVRVAPHLFNTAEEIDALLAALRELARA